MPTLVCAPRSADLLTDAALWDRGWQRTPPTAPRLLPRPPCASPAHRHRPAAPGSGPVGPGAAVPSGGRCRAIQRQGGTNHRRAREALARRPLRAPPHHERRAIDCGPQRKTLEVRFEKLTPEYPMRCWT